MTHQAYISTRARGVAAEQAILKATLQILSEGGYTALTIDRVAATAKASKTTIYRRWRTKEHLILAVFGQLPMAVPRQGKSFEEDLLILFGQFARIMERSPLRSVLPMLVAECANNPALAAALIQINDQRRQPMREVIARAIQRGELAPDTDIELVIDLIQGAISIRQHFLLERITRAWVRKLVKLLLAGIGNPTR